jgi:uncharacterized membrane protein
MYAPEQPKPVRERLVGLDVLRGLVMVLMAIDHVRVFSGLPAGGATWGLFFTRWATHFCAPVFVFLAGTGAYLYGKKHADLPRYLLTRGAWLVVLELTVVRLCWTFNLDFAHYALAGVIWVIGWSMILMSLLVRLPLFAVAAFGLLLVAGHDLFDGRFQDIAGGLGQGPLDALWRILYVGFFAGPIQLGPLNLFVLYSLVPWVGVMALGYAFGSVMTRKAEQRARICLALGLGATALFLVLRWFELYGDPRPWRGRPAMSDALAFFDTSKYPASLLFLLMTLGPAIALLPLCERARGPLAGVLETFGRVPLFFYLLHIPLIHALALCVSQLRTGELDPWLFANHPLGNPKAPTGYVWPLPVLYAVWLAAVVLLYPACLWFAHLKARRPERWLTYL